MGMTKAERLERDIRLMDEMKEHEEELRSSGLLLVAGMDEAGRGPLAGPVTAGAVVLPPEFAVPGINDSKKLTPKKRQYFYDIIRDGSLAFGLGWATPAEIDKVNILNATKMAMKRAVAAANEMLKQKNLDSIQVLLIDAVHIDDLDIPQESFIKGDNRCYSIAAASILAKVARDNYMEELDRIYPGYDFASNKGYGTAAHYDGIRNLGITPAHRKSFLKNFQEKHNR